MAQPDSLVDDAVSMVEGTPATPAERRREADNVLRELLETTQVPL